MSTELPCFRCGYDLRAHPRDGKCPECGESVAESRRWAAIPRRPLWKDSDARWRRRVLAGIWLLVLVPLMDALQRLGWADLLPAPNLFGYGSIRFNDTFLCASGVYPPIVFCMGAALLFSKEHNRPSSRFDWTRRWGIICTYVVLLLTAAIDLFVPALVLAGIAAVFMSMPLKNQPGVTRLFVELSTRYLRYGPYPRHISYCVFIAFSSTTILLACAPLWEALRSIGWKRITIVLLAPLAALAAMNIASVVLDLLRITPISGTAQYNLLAPYFMPSLLLWNTSWGVFFSPQSDFLAFAGEVVKWLIVFTIAVSLSIAQVAARFGIKRDRK